MTFNADQPRVPAGLPGAGRWIQAAFGSFEEAVDDFMAQLSAAMAAGKHKAFGIRVEDLPDPGAIGDALPVSRIWKNGEPTARLLPGTSTLGLASADRATVENAFKAMGLKSGTYDGYFGKVVYLVGGSSKTKGADKGESIIKDATVVAVYTRDSNAFAPLSRRL